MIEVFSDDSPDFMEKESDQFVLNPIRSGQDVLYSPIFGLPSMVDSGEYSLDLPGNEFIAAWDKPVSRVNGKVYFDILVFDHRGTEINRCARSESAWRQIVAGYFTNERSDGEMQIAAVSREARDGKFPVFIFNRGFKEPADILYENNENPNIVISRTTDYKLKVDF